MTLDSFAQCTSCSKPIHRCQQLIYIRRLTDNPDKIPGKPSIIKAIRISIMAAVGLLIAGGSILATSPNLGGILALVRYVLFALILCGLIGIEVYLWR